MANTPLKGIQQYMQLSFCTHTILVCKGRLFCVPHQFQVFSSVLNDVQENQAITG